MEEAENDLSLWEKVRLGDEVAFEMLFRRYYVELGRFSLKYVQEEMIAEEIVHDVFLKVWLKRKELSISTSLRAYLFSSVKNSSLNHLKSRYTRLQVHTELTPAQEPSQSITDQQLSVKELQGLLQEAIQQLPEKCRLIFLLRQETGDTYEVIAEQLGLSKKTVAAQMRIALQKIQAYLEKHWERIPIILLLGLL